MHAKSYTAGNEVYDMYLQIKGSECTVNEESKDGEYDDDEYDDDESMADLYEMVDDHVSILIITQKTTVHSKKN